MNVLYISHHIEIGGATKCFLTMLEQLPKKGVKPYVITPINNGVVMKYCKELNIDCYYFDYQDLIFWLPNNKLKRVLKSFLFPFFAIKNNLHNRMLVKKIKKEVPIDRIDFIHSNVNREDFGIMIAKKYDKKIIMHLREFGTKDFNLIYYKPNIYNYFNKNVDYFIAISNVIENFYKNKGIDEKKIIKIYDGIVSTDIVPKGYQINNENDSFKIMMMGYICDSKGQIQIVEALHLMTCKERKNIKVTFYGSGSKEYLCFLKNKIKDYDLITNFEFCDYQDNVYQSIANYDCGFTGSQSEAFGRVTVEYMMARLPVIASNTGANPELIVDKVDGLIYEYDNYQVLKNKILILKNDYQYRKKLGNQAYVDSQKFTSTLNTNNIYVLYEYIINKLSSKGRGGNS